MSQHLSASPGRHQRTTGGSRALDERPSPAPAQQPVSRTLFDDDVRMPYRWLRYASSPEVAEHFATENAHTDVHLSRLAPRIEELQRVAIADVPAPGPAVPTLLDGWWYLDRTDLPGGATLSRVRDGDGVRGASGMPEIIPGQLLEGEELLLEDCADLLGVALSPDHRLLARAEAGHGGCRLIVTELATGDVVDESLHSAGPDLVFSADSRALLHTRLDDLGRHHQVRCHVLGTDPSQDALLLEEPDHWAELTLTRSRDGSSLLLRSASPAGSEVWSVDLRDPAAAPRSLTGHLEEDRILIEHAGDRLLVLTEEGGARRSVLWEAPLDLAGGLRAGVPLLSVEDGEHIEAVEAFASFVALQMRSGGLPQVRLVPRRADGSLDVLAVRVVAGRGPLEAVRLEQNPDWGQRSLRVRVDSMLTPPTLLEHDLDAGTDRVLHRADVPGVDLAELDRFVEHRLWATAADGTRIPISLLARHDVAADGTAPLVLHGEGAFGVSLDPELRAESLALVAQGVVLAIAHVRGGGEMGPAWHARGSRLRRPDSIADFVTCADHLVATGWAAPDRVAAHGVGSGGLLVGAAANLAPLRFRAVVAGLPLADPLEALLRPDLMLTLEEWAEWGDPAADDAVYLCLRGISPAENVRETVYPSVFAWTALEGADVPSAGAAIWVAQLRDRVTSDLAERPVLLRAVPTTADSAQARAEAMAWLLDQLGAATLGG